MNTTILSNTGQVSIPKSLIIAHNWQVGQELIIVDTNDGILLKPTYSFKKTTITDVAGCLKYAGKPKSIEEMNEAIKQGIMDKFR